MTTRYHYRRGYVFGIAGVLWLSLLWGNQCGSYVSSVEAKAYTTAAGHEVYEKDDRLEFVEKKEEIRENPPAVYFFTQYMWITDGYDEKEIAESTHASFDQKNRLRYMLGYSNNILSGKKSYCEENVYDWDDAAHTCRYIYYKSTSVPYASGYYVDYRYMFDVCDYQFTEDGRLLSRLSYSRQIGSDPYGYSEEIFFNRGYQAEYDGERLMAELQYYDYWGTNETGAWYYQVYQYDDQGNCILMVNITEEDILLYCYEYDARGRWTGVYVYRVKEDWELSRDDGSIIHFQAGWGKPAVRRVAADKTVEMELYYGKAMDMGQQHYLMPEEVEETVNDHRYVVKPGDCLRNIAYRYYGNGDYYDLLYRVNRNVIGFDENLIFPGTRLFMPEVGNSQDTRKKEGLN